MRQKLHAQAQGLPQRQSVDRPAFRAKEAGEMIFNRASLKPSSASREFAARVAFTVAAIAFAVAIFIVDTFTPLGIAVAVLYAVVVLLAGRFVQRGGLLLISAACIAVTAFSFLFQHGLTYGPPLVRALVSIFAIALTTLLALKSQA